MCVNVVLVDSVSSSRSLHPVVPLEETSILYPVIASPPLFNGAVQLRTIELGPPAVAVVAVGTPGATFVVVVQTGSIRNGPTC